MSTAPPPLAADLHDGQKRLKMVAMRRLAPELGRLLPEHTTAVNLVGHQRGPSLGR
ncbi:MAG: hypothetical protein ACRDRG_15955 [Pseudonocardiaceae bacterium]